MLILLVLAALGPVILLGIRRGNFRADAIFDNAKAQITALQGWLMGLMALLLGFSLSMALGRFDDRSVAQVVEANAIVTAWLRTDRLDGATRTDLRAALAEYGQSPLAARFLSLTDREALDAQERTSAAAFGRAWTIATLAARQTPNPANMGVVAALNDMTDSFSSRDAAHRRHVPEPVLLLLFATFLFLGWMVGCATGVADDRPPPRSWSQWWCRSCFCSC